VLADTSILTRFSTVTRDDEGGRTQVAPFAAGVVVSSRILVTGAAGNLGRKAIAALAELDSLALIGVDRGPVGDLGPTAEFIEADLSTYDPTWAKRFGDVDVVLHLAADPKPIATWHSVLRSNLDLSHHVLRAAEENGVKRFVFASSNWVLGGYRFTSESLTPATPPRPVNPYGFSKLATERDGAAVTARCGMSFLALRLGWCQPGENLPGPRMAFGRWGQELWLSNDDWSQAVQRACTSRFEGCAVVNVMSDNVGMRWDLTDTEHLLGYRPLSRHIPQLPVRRRVTNAAARLRDVVFDPGAAAPRFGARW
jgi:NAD+ dependent glucose-6-phosphate dehydrogenase